MSTETAESLTRIPVYLTGGKFLVWDSAAADTLTNSLHLYPTSLGGSANPTEHRASCIYPRLLSPSLVAGLMLRSRITIHNGEDRHCVQELTSRLLRDRNAAVMSTTSGGNNKRRRVDANASSTHHPMSLNEVRPTSTAPTSTTASSTEMVDTMSATLTSSAPASSISTSSSPPSAPPADGADASSAMPPSVPASGMGAPSPSPAPSSPTSSTSSSSSSVSTASLPSSSLPIGISIAKAIVDCVPNPVTRRLVLGILSRTNSAKHNVTSRSTTTTTETIDAHTDVSLVIDAATWREANACFHLHEEGYHISGGQPYGSRWAFYLDAPSVAHSSFIVRAIRWEQPLQSVDNTATTATCPASASTSHATSASLARSPVSAAGHLPPTAASLQSTHRASHLTGLDALAITRVATATDKRVLLYCAKPRSSLDSDIKDDVNDDNDTNITTSISSSSSSSTSSTCLSSKPSTSPTGRAGNQSPDMHYFTVSWTHADELFGNLEKKT